MADDPRSTDAHRNHSAPVRRSDTGRNDGRKIRDAGETDLFTKGVVMCERFWIKVDKSNDCWNWTATKNRSGYGQFRYEGRIVKAHRFSYELSNGKIAAGLSVCHTCDNTSCVNPSHLFIGTDGDNKRDMYQKKRHVFGEKHPNSKLCVATVLAIRDEVKNGVSHRVIALKYNTQKSQVSLIANRKRWDSV